MTTFNITQISSTASPLYDIQALDITGKILTTFQIAANEGDDVQALALEAYTLLISPIAPPTTAA